MDSLESVRGQNGWTPTAEMRLGLLVRYLRLKEFGGIAQLVERLVRNEKVRGSNPLTSTTGREHKRLRSRFKKRHGAWPRILTRSDRARHVREPSERIKLGLRRESLLLYQSELGYTDQRLPNLIHFEARKWHLQTTPN